MRSSILAITIGSAALAFSSAASARDGAWYVEFDGGVMFVDDLDFDIGGINNAATLKPDSRDFGVKVDGYDFGAIVGHDFGMFRLEAEVSYRSADAGVISSDVRLPALTPVAPGGLTGGAAPGVYRRVGGKVSALSGMANAMIDFGPDNGLQGFIGGGVGIAKVDTKLSLAKAGPGVVDDDDTGFAWQAIAGVRAPLNDNMDVGIKYRFFNANSVDLTDSSGRDMSARWRSHSLMGTFTFNFGGVREAVAVPVAPPPPPPPPPPVYEAAPPPPPPPPVRPAERG